MSIYSEWKITRCKYRVSDIRQNSQIANTLYHIVLDSGRFAINLLGIFTMSKKTRFYHNDCPLSMHTDVHHTLGDTSGTTWIKAVLQCTQNNVQPVTRSHHLRLYNKHKAMQCMHKLSEVG